MPSKLPHSYWDACLFIHYAAADPKWIEKLDAMVGEARASGRAIVTSTLSRVEAAFIPREKEQRVLSAEVDDAMSAMFDDFSLIQLVEFDRDIAVDARRLVRTATGAGRSLKAADAVHIASAKAHGVEMLYTTDTQLVSLSNALGIQQASLPFSRSPYLPGMSPAHDAG